MIEGETKKTYLVTGASSGIGLETVRLLLQEGHKVIASSREPLDLDNLRLSPFKDSGHIHPVHADMEKVESIDSLGIELKRLNQALDGVVLAAGYHELRPLKLMKPEHWQKMFLINTVAPAHVIKVLIANKLLKKPASVIFFSSIAAVKAEPGAVAYSASKGALISMTRSLAGELASQGIRVNCISPGVVKTKMSEKMLAQLSDRQRASLEEAHLLGFGQTEDVTPAVEFLLSDKSRWITGQNLVLDGGASL